MRALDEPLAHLSSAHDREDAAKSRRRDRGGTLWRRRHPRLSAACAAGGAIRRSRKANPQGAQRNISRLARACVARACTILFYYVYEFHVAHSGAQGPTDAFLLTSALALDTTAFGASS